MFKLKRGLLFVVVRESLMKPRSIVTLILVASICISVFSNAVLLGNAETGKVDVIVGFTDAPDLELLKQHGGEIIHVYGLIPAVYASLPKIALTQLQGNPKVAYIEENTELQVSGSVRWAVERVGAPQAWSQSTGAGVKVAVLDTGVGPHRDLTVYGGYDFVNNDADASDDMGHGTMVAGIIAASASSPLGVAGAAPNAQLYAVKILDSKGSGSVALAIQGIQWAVDNGMQIVSMSWTINDYNNALRDALQAAYNRGVLLVAAAGNIGDVQSGVACPASYGSVIAVSAIDENNMHLPESCVGDKIELTAPGEMVYATWLNDQLGCGNGTSMAAPFVSGVAALVWAKNPSLTNVQVREILDATAVDLQPSDGLDRDIFYGFGLVNAAAAVSATPSNLEATFSWSPMPVYAGAQVSFDAGASFGGVNGFTSYMWDFGDGATATESSPVVVHSFAASGGYIVNLTVSDAFGFRNSTLRNVAVQRDSAPPVTGDNYDGLLHTSPFTITLTASDNESSVMETYYRINDGTTKNVTAHGQPQINVDGLTNKLEYWSIDFAGNEETPHKVLANIKLDITPDATPTPSSSVQPTQSPSQSPPPTTQPTNQPTLTPTETPTGSSQETLPPQEGQFPVLLVVGVVSVAVVLAVFTLFWHRKR